MSERQTMQVERARDEGNIEAHRWKRRCESLTKLCEATAWSAEPDLVYQRMTDAVVDVLRCRQAHLHLLTADGDRFITLAYHADEPHRGERVLSATVGRMRWMMKTHLPIVMDYENPHCDDQIPEEAYLDGFKSAVSIPLVAEGELVGMCSIVYEAAIDWEADGIAYLLKVGRVLGVAIRRMQITKKAVELKMLDERKRLSSEIHDNVSQIIGSLSLSAAAALASYDAGDDEAVRADLERLEETGGTAMRILRDEMLSLRIPLEQTDGLLTGIRDSVTHFEGNWGIPVDLKVKSTTDPLVVPLQTSLQLTRILNECLSNTLRHAEANSIRVSVLESSRCLTMAVEDDGCGFDPQDVPSERLGLKIMRERAAAAGGKLTILSGDGGTTVCVDIPKTQLNGGTVA